MKNVTIKIRLGNEAMQTEKDISDALITIAQKILRGSQEGKVMDINGNSVGTYKIN